MKKRFLALVLTLVMALALTVPAFAAEDPMVADGHYTASNECVGTVDTGLKKYPWDEENMMAYQYPLGTVLTIKMEWASWWVGDSFSPQESMDLVIDSTEITHVQIGCGNCMGTHDCYFQGVAADGTPTQPTTPAEPEQPVVHPSAQPVTIDGEKMEFQMYAIRDEKGNDKNYIKIRDLALALKGTAAQFDVGKVDGVITFTSGAEYIPNGSENSTPYTGEQAFTKNSGNISVNGTLYPIDAFQITHNGGGYTYFKVEDIAQKLNFNVAWRGGIVIETDKPYTGN